MLFSGIIIAFIGIAVFAVYAPEPQLVKQGDANAGPLYEEFKEFLMRSLRPIGMLFFVETIAWFLLRQYRMLIEDYKYFYRIYLKRQNYLVSLLTIQDLKNTPEGLVLITAMLQEDLSGRLSRGETSEAAEQLKFLDQNPILAVAEIVSRHIASGKKTVESHREPEFGGEEVAPPQRRRRVNRRVGNGGGDDRSSG
jgi:hypothetical protein